MYTSKSMDTYTFLWTLFSVTRVIVSHVIICTRCGTSSKRHIKHLGTTITSLQKLSLASHPRTIRFYQLLFHTSRQESSQVAISPLYFTNLKTKPSATAPKTAEVGREASLIIYSMQNFASQSSVALQAPHSTAPG